MEKCINKARKNFLSPKERDCLYWISEGVSSEKIADIVFVGMATYRTYCKRIKRKLGAKTLAHAVKLAIKKGFIN